MVLPRLIQTIPGDVTLQKKSCWNHGYKSNISHNKLADCSKCVSHLSVQFKWCWKALSWRLRRQSRNSVYQRRITLSRGFNKRFSQTGAGKVGRCVKEGRVQMREEGGMKRRIAWALGLGHFYRLKTIGSYLDAIQTPGAVIRLPRMGLWEGCEWDAGAQQFKAFQGSFPTDDGDFLKQVKLTGQLPETLCPASLHEGNLTEGGDDWAEAPGQLPKPHYTRQGIVQHAPPVIHLIPSV